jgi:hypothetical protein
MPIDWCQVTVGHVQQACDLYDAGSAVPKRPAKNTFLVLNGKSYPAKFIRGLAYQIATGVTLDPSRDYSGGNETARFFTRLKLQTCHTHSETVTPLQPKLQVRVREKPTEKHRYEPQKQGLFDLLKKRFGNVHTEATFPWLVVPKLDGLNEHLASIFQVLQGMRGYTNFATVGKRLRCDFHIPDKRLIIEYDERQHFTLQRASALEHYPPDLSLGFDRGEWIAACKSIRAKDPNPAYRDEQRAFYDTLRDILSAQNGYRLVRFRQGQIDWTTPDAEGELTVAVPATSVSLSWMKRSANGDAAEIRRIGLVAHDYTVPDEQGEPDNRGPYDYSEHFTHINKLCDEHGCDTILYALHTLNPSFNRTHKSIFESLKHVERIILEVKQPPNSYVEIWSQSQQEPVRADQHFARSKERLKKKQRFLDDLPLRQIGSALLVICGESNIVSWKRKSKMIEDRFGFQDRLQDLKIGVVLNPIHDYMRRYEMKKKRRFYSQGGRTVISVWNKGKGKESKLPWTVFHDGEEKTEKVQVVSKPFMDRPDICIGVVDLAQL